MSSATSKSPRVAVVGASGSGKTLAINLLRKRIVQPSKTIGAEYYSHKVTNRNGERMRVNIWDCSGDRVYEKVAHIHLQRSDMALIFYGSFLKDGVEQMKYWVSEALKAGIPKQKIWVVRNNRAGREEMNLDAGKNYCQREGIVHKDIDASNTAQVLELFNSLVESQPLNRNTSQSQDEANIGKIFLGSGIQIDADVIKQFVQYILEQEKEGQKSHPSSSTDLAGEEAHVKVMIHPMASRMYQNLEKYSKFQAIRKEVPPLIPPVIPPPSGEKSFYQTMGKYGIALAAVAALGYFGYRRYKGI